MSNGEWNELDFWLKNYQVEIADECDLVGIICASHTGDLKLKERHSFISRAKIRLKEIIPDKEQYESIIRELGV